MPAAYDEIVQDLDRSLALISHAAPSGRIGLTSKFAQLIASARMQARPAPDDVPLHQFYRSAQFAEQDLFNLFTLVERITWMRERVHEGIMSQDLFDRFATSDIDMFHIEFRSIFDYLAQAMAGFAKTQLPSSFRKLRDRILPGEGYAEEIGVEIAAAVTDCNWFGYLKDTRDHLVHHGDMTLIFPHERRLLFQTFANDDIRIIFPPVMFNENIADFEIYAGMWLGRLYDYLERWSERMFRISRVRPMGEPIICNGGVAVAVDWMRRTRTVFAEFAARDA